MKYDMIISGVGGQGILSISYVVDNAALEQGLSFKQSEVHGMAQRGGAVVSHLRISDQEIFSDLVPYGAGDIVLSMEPMESLRYTDYLGENGKIITSCSTFVNIPDYPELDGIISQIQAQNSVIVNAEGLARNAGSVFAQNIVMLGAASSLIPIENKLFENHIAVLFEAKGQKIIDVNIKAFRTGAIAAENYRALMATDLDPIIAWKLSTKIAPVEYSEAVFNQLVELAADSAFLDTLLEQRGVVEFSDELLTAVKAAGFTVEAMAAAIKAAK